MIYFFLCRFRFGICQPVVSRTRARDFQAGPEYRVNGEISEAEFTEASGKLSVINRIRLM